MKSKRNYLENYARHPKLSELTLSQGGVDWKTIKENPEDYYAANTGSVTGMIYYSDTVPFAKKNLVLIMNALNEFEEECGRLDKPTDDETTFYNWLAWFAWENTMSEVISYLEE
jgi:hypothetical protein